MDVNFCSVLLFTPQTLSTYYAPAIGTEKWIRLDLTSEGAHGLGGKWAHPFCPSIFAPPSLNSTVCSGATIPETYTDEGKAKT